MLVIFKKLRRGLITVNLRPTQPTVLILGKLELYRKKPPPPTTTVTRNKTKTIEGREGMENRKERRKKVEM